MKTKQMVMALALGALLGGPGLAQKDSAPPAAEGSGAPEGPSGTAPATVVASAWAAVAKLGSEVSRGNYAMAIERMNPVWKERLAKQTKGGMAEIEKQIEGAAKLMTQKGVSIISSIPQGTARSFEVGPGKRVEKANGEDVEILIFTKWLVFVPTLTKYRLLLEGDPKPVYIEKVGYQVAVSDKGKLEWTFIDGSGLTLNALRRLYVTLPQDLELPRIEERKAAETR
ncbi:MAG: hypothetical protein NTW21_08950 [Verrucomicrobia bacterium]|nr:hypothetical protein [Verrucomicrobiota bacterium]